MTAHDTYLCWESLEILAESLPPSERSALLRAGRGAEFLDEHEPGWHERLRPVLGWLDLGSQYFCVGGHLHGSYGAALAEWGLTDDEAADVGLEHVDTIDPLVILADYAALTEAWRTLTIARCAGGRR